MEAYDPTGLNAPSSLATYLRGAKALEVLPLAGGGGHGRKRAVILEGGVGVVAKYSDRISGSMAGTMIRAEAAAWELASELGWQDLVPATVLRELEDPDDPGDDVEASVQILLPRFVTSLEGAFTADVCDVDDQMRCAVFDVLALNTDRNSSNWGRLEGARLPKLIDHGHAFETFGGTAAGDFVDSVRGYAIPSVIYRTVEEFVSSESNSDLAELIGEDKARRLFARARTLVQVGVLQAP